jgi:cob(I)alamin adenosyltransferase
MNKHVEYEYVMMKLVDRYWGTEERVPLDMWNNMCNIVAFNTAQNLAWYLSYKGVALPVEVSNILGKIYNQISTLDVEFRTDVQEEKLQPEDFKYLMAWIDTKKEELGIS